MVKMVRELRICSALKVYQALTMVQDVLSMRFILPFLSHAQNRLGYWRSLLDFGTVSVSSRIFTICIRTCPVVVDGLGASGIN